MRFVCVNRRAVGTGRIRACRVDRAMCIGGRHGKELIDAILARGDLAEYHLAHSARADLCRRLGRLAEARASYEQALRLTRQGPERRFLERRLGELPD